MGVLFGYYVITPMSLNFLASYTVSAKIQNLFYYRFLYFISSHANTGYGYGI